MRLLSLVIGSLLIMAPPALGRRTSTCVCATIESPGSRTCVVAPGHRQRWFAQRALTGAERCTPELCRVLYDAHRSSSGVAGYTCDAIATDPQYLAELLTCRTDRPTAFHLSLTRDFDAHASTQTPNAYNPIRLDVNDCSVPGVAATVSAYITALKHNGCGCENMVLNLDTHGITENGVHQTKCELVTPHGSGRRYADLPSKQLALELTRVLHEQGCEKPTLVFDSCFSGQILKDFGATPLTVPLIVTTAATCVAPGNSNLWSNHIAWCHRCDADGNGRLTLGEISACLPKTPFQTGLTDTGHIMMVAEGPVGLGHARSLSPDYPVFRCAKAGPAHRTGLQRRDWNGENKAAHQDHSEP